MAVMIRLARRGAKNNPEYAIVAVHKASRRDGDYLEKLGYFFPKQAKNRVRLNLESMKTWVAKGAQVSPTVAKLAKTLEKSSA